MTEPLALDIGSTVQNTVDVSVRVGIRLLIFLAILTAGWLLARLVRKAVRSGLRRLRAGELVAWLLCYALLLLAVHIGYAVSGPNPVGEPVLLIVVVAAAIARAGHDLVSAALGRFPYGSALSRGTQVTIIGLGVVAALNQAGVATTVTGPVLIAVLATVGGILVVGVGGGLIQPMRNRWERLLSRAEREGAAVAPNRPAGAYEARTGAAAHDIQRPVPPATGVLRPPGSVARSG